MRSISRRALFGACMACGAAHAGLTATPVQAQGSGGWSPPASAQRCPSRWGANDRRGSMNHMTPERMRDAAQMIREGRKIEIGHMLTQSMPFFGTRRFDVHLKQQFMNPQANRRGSNEEIVITELAQVGTQLDAFPHQTIGDETYNCVNVPGISSRGGFTEMGVETVGTIMARGVVMDIAGLKGTQTLPIDYEITPQDLQQALDRQRVELREGDAMLINTGWAALWGRDNARYVSGCPGLGVAAAEWLIERGPLLLGADNWPVEVAPSRTMPHASLPVHQIALVVHGVHLLENMKLDELVAAGRSEFCFVMQPLRARGFTGSTVAPAAMF
ncbi:cyclase family protein [Roseococcus suduntuyensis]|uniref:Kynurenine formamidase n=1 Tax=Roseococcus suduntuyensis TaxID=455361 RepID=A0A840A8T9_9PROT|nr:cyclase family protein [Roseococcus suduntuyensis]MBB3897611.1 kynurenine formamidase [Roseococcus suduntuyensis]